MKLAQALETGTRRLEEAGIARVQLTSEEAAHYGVWQHMAQADAHAGADTVAFSSAFHSSRHTISLTSGQILMNNPGNTIISTQV